MQGTAALKVCVTDSVRVINPSLAIGYDNDWRYQDRFASPMLTISSKVVLKLLGKFG
ncbi:MAG: hypothetical protein ACTH4C_08270 [Psychrobacter celer]